MCIALSTNYKIMFGKYFKHVLVLTALAWLTYTLPSVRAALDSAYVDASGNMAAAAVTSTVTVGTTTSTPAKKMPVSVIATSPKIKMYVTASQGVSDSKLSISTGEELYFYGTPENIKGLTYGKDYTAAFFFPEKLLTCKNNNIGINPTWIMTCTANNSRGEGKMYMQIYRGGRTFTSNVIRVSVGGTSVVPSIKVMSPNGGETYSVNDKTVQIKWESANIPQVGIQIALTDKSGEIVRQIVEMDKNTGSYNWKIPQDLVQPGTVGAFKVLIGTADKGPSAQDYSDNYFSVKGLPCEEGMECPPVEPPTTGCYIFNTNLQIGSMGQDVVALQKWLAEHGFAIPTFAPNTGVYDQATAEAVMKFQASVGLPMTGFVGPLTRAVLNACGPTTPTNPPVAVCPVGFICQPSTDGTYQDPSNSNCPIGYICSTNESADVTFVSSAATITSGDSANDDIGTFNIKMKVTAVGGDVYVPVRPGALGFQYMIDKAGVTVPSNFISATVTSNSGSSLSQSGNMQILEGETEYFELSVAVPMGNRLTAGMYKLSLSGVAWDSTDTANPSKSTKTNTDTFKTNYVSLN